MGILKVYEQSILVIVDTHTQDAVDEGVVAGVAHRQPVEQEEKDVDVLKPKT